MKIMNNTRVLAKIGAAFSAMIVTSIVVSAVTWHSTSVMQTTGLSTAHTYEVIDKISSIVAHMVDQETGLRGFLIANDSKFLEPFVKGAAKFTDETKIVRQLTSDNMSQQKRLDDLEASAKSWKLGADKAIILMKDPSTIDDARRIESSGSGKTAFDALRAKAEDMKAVERQLLQQRSVDAQTAASTSTLSNVGGGLLLVTIVTLALVMLNSALVRPIKSLTAQMEATARGETGVKITGTERGDEIGVMARAFDDNATRIARLAKLEQEREAGAIVERRNATLDLANRFENSVGGIVKMVSEAATELQATAQQLTASAQETSAQSKNVSSASEEAGSNIATVASSAEELGASVGEIGRQVEISTTKSRAAVGEAQSTAAIMAELNEAASHIGTVVELISGIASQTNLLALNATIEAARAGESGRGFAVVAQEVKALAEQTSKATSEIGQQITGIQTKTGKAVAAIQDIATTIREIDEVSAAIASAVEQQGAATREIVQAMAQSSDVTATVTQNIHDVARAAGETGLGASQVLESSSELSVQAERLSKEVASFLATVRAA